MNDEKKEKGKTEPTDKKDIKEERRECGIRKKDKKETRRKGKKEIRKEKKKEGKNHLFPAPHHLFTATPFRPSYP